MAEDTILTDGRPIKSISWDNDEGAEWCAERDGVTIEAYAEPGQESFVPFYRVIKNGNVIYRVPAHHVSVSY